VREVYTARRFGYPEQVSAGSILRAFLQPVLPENRALLQRIRAELPPSLSGPRQMYGRQTRGCAATIGAQPRCDFACSGCYLGDEANRIPPRTVAELGEQMELIREFVGPFGNLQLTDGEITLRPVDELLELLEHARRLELVPMIMTHGETFRRNPALLERLVVEGGLREVALHVDTTQRGRRQRVFDHARTEEELEPLRDELADLVRDVRARTGADLRAATTMTVTAENLAGVAHVVDWTLRNADVFRLLSFQPAAQVGRTLPGLGGRVTTAALWDAIAAGMGDEDRERLERGRLSYGHPDCTRSVLGLVHERADGARRFQLWRDLGEARDERALDGFFARFGGITLRGDTRPEALARMAGVLATAPLFWARELPPYALRLARRLEPRNPGRLLWRLAARRERLRPLAILSHHFMERAELETPVGRERVAACNFRVPHEGRMVSMCQVNAGGLREEHYAELASRVPRRSERRRPVEAEVR